MNINPSERKSVGYRINSDDQTELHVHRIHRLYLQLRRGNFLYFLSAGCQMLAGLLLVGVAVTGSIKTMWLATVLSAMGSVVSMTGAYLLYDLLRNRYNVDHLVKDAINRAISNLN